jgi:predicted nucleic acid-binding protein
LGRLSMRIYLDSAVIIYLVEQPPGFFPAVVSWLKKNPGDLVSGELARMESLVIPVRTGNLALVKEFEDFFRLQVVQLGALDRPVLDRTVQIRASFPKIKTPDAIHLASAVELSCDVVLTNDPDMLPFTGVKVELI